MVMRQFETVDTEEKVKVIEESVEKAKEAVGLDIKDGTSWCKYSLNMKNIYNICICKSTFLFVLAIVRNLRERDVFCLFFNLTIVF